MKLKLLIHVCVFKAVGVTTQLFLPACLQITAPQAPRAQARATALEAAASVTMDSWAPTVQQVSCDTCRSLADALIGGHEHGSVWSDVRLSLSGILHGCFSSLI